MFGFFKAGPAAMDMASASQELRSDTSIRLVDVRTPEEYAGGHIPGSLNIPLDQANDIVKRVPDHDAKIFVYCLSGARSRSACGIFTKLGYTNVTNIGGINNWPGKTTRN